MRYDSEIKRTFEKVALGVLKILGFEIVEIKTIPLEMQIGKLVADFLAIVRLKDGSEYILHIEFQTRNDPDMPKRMLRYCSVIISRFNLPIIQIVVFLGKEELSMESSIKINSLGTSLFYEYQIIDLKKVEAQKFLSSDEPDIYLLGVLGRADNLVEVVRKILSKLKESFEKGNITKQDLLEYISRLGVFSELRDISEDLRREVEQIVLDIDITKTWLYKEGLERGKKEGLEEGVKKGLEKGKKEGLEEGIRKGLEKGKKQGRKQGLEEGLVQGLKEAILFAVQIKFGKRTSKIQKKIKGINDINTLRFLKREVARVRTLQEFESKLKALNHR